MNNKYEASVLDVIVFDARKGEIASTRAEIKIVFSREDEGEYRPFSDYGEQAWSYLNMRCLIWSKQLYDDDNNEPIHYPQPLCYGDIHKVGVGQLCRMLKTLKSIESKLAKLEEDLGRTSTFASYVQRVAIAVKAKKIVFDNHYRRTPIVMNIEEGVKKSMPLSQNSAKIAYRLTAILTNLLSELLTRLRRMTDLALKRLSG